MVNNDVTSFADHHQSYITSTTTTTLFIFYFLSIYYYNFMPIYFVVRSCEWCIYCVTNKPNTLSYIYIYIYINIQLINYMYELNIERANYFIIINIFKYTIMYNTINIYICVYVYVH